MLIGGVGKNPEVRDVNGSKVASFSLATSEKYKDRNGEEHENTEWHNLVCWRSQAEFVEKYVKKGDKLYVEGKLRTRSWEKDGKMNYATEIVVDKVEFFSGKRQDTQQQDQPEPEGDIPF